MKHSMKVSRNNTLKVIFMEMNKHNQYMLRKSFPLFVGIVILLASFPVIASSSDAMLVWAEQDNDGVYHIYFSEQARGNWSEPFLISATANPEILPAIGSDSRGNIWLAWTEMQGVTGHILWSHCVDGSWSEPAVLVTPTEAAMAPFIAVDTSGKAWMVYSGSENKDDDIYATHWNGSTWAMPTMINIDDQWPDIQPIIKIDSNGLPVVFWQGYNGDGYVQYQSHWDGSHWSPERQNGQALKQVSGKENPPDLQIEESVQNLPLFLSNTSQAVFHSTVGERKTFRLTSH